MPMKWMLVIYHKGKRIEKLIDDPRPYLPQVKALRGKGAKVNLIPMKAPESRYYPPAEDDLSNLAEGMLWCPYCGDWRYFVVPPYRPQAEADSREWWLNLYATQGIRSCKWCTISTQDWYVKRANGLFGNMDGKRKRKSRKSRR
jgi:hypothetical protein